MTDVLPVKSAESATGPRADSAPVPPTAAPGRRVRWAGLRRHLTPGSVFAAVVLLLVVLAAVLPDMLARQSPFVEDTSRALAAPSGQNWFGTDYLGRDIYSRVVHGTRLSVVSALLAVAIGLVAGSALGLLAGHRSGGAADAVGMRIVDTLLAVPGLLLSMAVVVALGFSTINAAIAVGVGAVAAFARLMRSEVLRIRNLPYLEAAELVGARGPSLVFGHILVNAWASVLALAVLQFGAAILAIASLAFLGYGDSPPSPEWGVQVAEGQKYIFAAPWMVAFPSVAIVLVVLAVNRLSALIKEVSSDD